MTLTVVITKRGRALCGLKHDVLETGVSQPYPMLSPVTDVYGHNTIDAGGQAGK